MKKVLLPRGQAPLQLLATLLNVNPADYLFGRAKSV